MVGCDVELRWVYIVVKRGHDVANHRWRSQLRKGKRMRGWKRLGVRHEGKERKEIQGLPLAGVAKERKVSSPSRMWWCWHEKRDEVDSLGWGVSKVGRGRG